MSSSDFREVVLLIIRDVVIALVVAGTVLAVATMIYRQAMTEEENVQRCLELRGKEHFGECRF